MQPKASLRLFSIRGVPVFAHVSLLIGFPLVSRLAFRPLAWLGLMIVVLVHELGHAVLLRRFRSPVLYIVLHAFGGECVSTGFASAFERSVVAWGGVLGQALLLGLVLAGAAARLWSPAIVE